ncbi:ABC transporter ATP-binding protein [Salarchaeum sp. III]|uniref:ABC transporter ATP-binding protein n=1 Tax=Salarchaeum sp. III TaxID=3107927 RepID=UPI002ED94F17
MTQNTLDARDAGTEEPLVSVRDLKTYYTDNSIVASKPPVKAVDGVSFDIYRGETLGLVGESGCGKSTLGRTMLGLETATDGDVLVDGTDVADLSGRERREWARNAGMVFQDPEESLNDRMTVGEIVREPLDAHSVGTPDERRERVRDLLDTVGLQPEHYYRYPHQFSGGQKQRIGIARALALEPDFLVLDEPTSALDVSVQARIINLLNRLQDDLGLTYLFISHDLSVMQHIADRIAVMYLGNVAELGPAREVFADPEHPYTVSLLSAVPGRHGTDVDRIALPGTPPSPRDPPSGCTFNTRCPAKIRPEKHDDLSIDAWDAIEAFREVLRGRALGQRGVLADVKRRLGFVDADVTESVDELFSNVTIDGEAWAVIEESIDLADDARYAEAEAVLADEFGGVCEEQDPANELGDGRVSRCHRHREEYEDVTPVIERRRADD